MRTLQHFGIRDKTAYNFKLSASQNPLGFECRFRIQALSESLLCIVVELGGRGSGLVFCVLIVTQVNFPVSISKIQCLLQFIKKMHFFYTVQ